MSDPNPNAAGPSKERTAAAIVRCTQALIPGLDDARLLLQEINDVVAVYGPLTDADLTRLGINAATITTLATFLTQLVAFVDAPAANRNAFRITINSIRRSGAQI